MNPEDFREAAHDLDVTVWVGKSGIDPVVAELDDQFDDRDLVKVRFLRAAVGDRSVEALAEDLAERVDAEVVDVRGKTAVLHR